MMVVGIVMTVGNAMLLGLTIFLSINWEKTNG